MLAQGDLQAVALAALYVAGVALAFAGNRTALHVAMGNVSWFAFLLQDPRLAVAGAALLAALAGVAHLRQTQAWKEVMAGESDLGPVAFFVALAAMAALWWLLALPTWWFVASYLCMAFADPAGFYAGRAWGRRRLPNGKSAEGFTAVLAVSFAVALAFEAAFAPAPLAALAGRAALAGLGSALGEGLAPRHTDNLLMPLGALAGLGLGHALLP